MRIDGKEVPVVNMLFTAEQLKCLEQAKDKPIVYDEDSPETTPERAARFRRVKPSKAAANGQ